MLPETKLENLESLEMGELLQTFSLFIKIFENFLRFFPWVLVDLKSFFWPSQCRVF